MAAEERWYFTKDQLENTPSRKCGIEPEKELSYRQQAANFIQDMGQKLQVSQLCINTAIVYMHRFFMFHSFKKFHRNAISMCAIFLAAKVEEQPRKLEHVIKVAQVFLHRDAPPLDTKSEAFLEHAQELVINENIMLQTLGFDVAIDHPHTHVVNCCHLVRGELPSLHQHHTSKDLAQTSYFMATNSLHLTTMCLQYKPSIVACVCIHLACKWANWEIPKSSEGKQWFWYVDKTATEELLEELTAEFLAILDRCPSRLKRKMLASGAMKEKLPDNALDKKLNNELPHLAGPGLKSSAPHSANSTMPKTEKVDRTTGSSSSNTAASLSAAAKAKYLLEKSEGGQSTSGSDKNGNLNPPTCERKEKVKKEHPTLSALPTPNSVASLASGAPSAAALPRSPPASNVAGDLLTFTPTTDSPVAPNSLDHSQASLHSLDSPATPSKKLKGDGGTALGLTTPTGYREYKERKKRERAEKGLLDKSTSSFSSSSSTASAFPASGSKMERLEKVCVKGLDIGNASLASLNLQPVVSLTHLNLSALGQLTATKQAQPQQQQQHQRPPKQQKTPDKQPKALSESGKTSNRHHHHHHPPPLKNSLGAVVTPPEEKNAVRGGEEGNHVGRSHRATTPLKPSAQLLGTVPGKESEFRTEQILPEAQQPLPPPPPLVPIVARSSPPQVQETMQEEDSHKAIIPGQMKSVSNASAIPDKLVSSLLPPAATQPLQNKAAHNTVQKSDHRKTDKGATAPPSASHHSVRSPSKHGAKEAAERVFKHHKSKTSSPMPPPTVAVTHEPQTTGHAAATRQDLPPVVLSEVNQQPVASPALNVSLAPESQDDVLRTSKSCLPVPVAPSLAATAASLAVALGNDQGFVGGNVQQVVEASNPQPKAMDTPQETPLHSNFVNVIATTDLASQEKSLKNGLAPSQPPSGGGDALVTLPQLVIRADDQMMPAPVMPVVPKSQPAVATHSGKHERREKHRHKDKDRAHSKKEDAASATPAIKLTIPKERLVLAASSLGQSTEPGGSASASKRSSSPPKEKSGGLKIKISKEKLVAGSKSKSGSSNSTVVMPAPPPATTVNNPPHPTAAVLEEAPAVVKEQPVVAPASLKIKITKDRVGSKEKYNLSKPSEPVSSKEKPERESRKREREVAPVVAKSGEDDLIAAAGDSITPDGSRPAKIMKQSARTLRRSTENRSQQQQQQPTGNSNSSNSTPLLGPVTSPLDVPPSSNTRSSRNEHGGLRHAVHTPDGLSGGGHQRHQPGHHPQAGGGRGHKGSKHGGGNNMGMLPMHPHHYRQQVNMNAAAGGGGSFYNQYYPPPPFPPRPPNASNYFGRPQMGHPGDYPPPHQNDYPPPPPQFYSQYGPPPPHMRHLPPMSFQQHPPPSMMLPPQQQQPPPLPQQQQQQRPVQARSMPPLPREPPPAQPPPPPD